MNKMKKTMLLLALLTAAGLTQASDVHVGVTVEGQVSPGVYGRVNIGNAPPPLVYTTPVVVVQQPAVVRAAPVYLHVPPGHAKKWSKHCHKYNACAQPVYFVKSAEYDPGYGRRASRGRDDGHAREHYAREHHGREHRDRYHGHGRGHGHDKGKHKD